jgi:hypothetical protein
MEQKLRRIWKDACKKAGIDNVTCYEDTRHSFITQKLEEGVEESAVSSWVGHKCRETIKKYDHSKKLKLLELAMVKNKKGLPVYNYLKTLLFMARLAGVEPATYGFVARTLEFSNLLNLLKLLENLFFILADFPSSTF